VIRRFGHALVVFALVVSVGGHWAVLQSVAWVSMAVHFAQTDPLIVALEKTFDGKHPCDLCKVVQQGKTSKTPSDSPKVQTRLDLCLFERPAFLQCALPHLRPTPPRMPCFGRADAPPVPPPRSA
jgi:hypothetical protein